MSSDPFTWAARFLSMLPLKRIAAIVQVYFSAYLASGQGGAGHKMATAWLLGWPPFLSPFSQEAPCAVAQ
ncbi:MAG: hypothetical protein IT427_10795 [Pirellulales bacterium]|nr:hypothetical protein [Pirellulales bacterium]